jgi:hypothetical protein
VRSKQNMRHSKIVKQLRGRATKEERKKAKEKVKDEKIAAAAKASGKSVRRPSVASADASSAEAKPKKARVEAPNAAFMRFKNDDYADDEE